MKYTLITGAASGLGKELARIYAENGNNLLLIDYDEENLNKVNEELKLSLIHISEPTRH